MEHTAILNPVLYPCHIPIIWNKVQKLANKAMYLRTS